MTDENTANNSAGRIHEEFESLPLDKKFASLLQMEMVTITEAFNCMVNFSARAFEKAGAAIEEFGAKFEKEAAKAAASTGAKKATGDPKNRPSAKATDASTSE